MLIMSMFKNEQKKLFLQQFCAFIKIYRFI
jgi:hypothetical protein